MTPEMAAPSDDSRRAAILVAEDDRASGQFFDAALARCGWDACIVADGHAALAFARTRYFDALLLDCHLPGAGAVAILSALRADPDAACHDTPAIATSAELHAAQRPDLRRAGFAGAMRKPVTLDELKAALRPLLARDVCGAEPLLDDVDAIVNSGAPAAVSALRGLFVDELRRLANELEPLAAHPDELAERLHRLLASCGFCGAHALAGASHRLKQELEHGSASAADLERFRQTLTATLSALTAQARAGPADQNPRPGS